MSQILLYIAVLPSLVLGSYVYKMDRMGKEPSNLLFKLFISGLGAVVLTLILSIPSMSFFPLLDPDNSHNFISLAISIYIGVALIEEGSKWLFLYLLTWKNKEFDHIYDAIVYAVFVSLGFATIENILYVSQLGLYTAIIRAVISVPGHVFFAVFMGYYYGIAKQASLNNNKKLFNNNIFLSLLTPILIHGTFDYCLYLGNIIVTIIFFIFLIFLYIISFKKIKQFSNISLNMTSNNSNSQI